MSGLDMLTQRERKVLAAIADCRDGTPAEVARRTGLSWQAVVIDAGALRKLMLVRRRRLPERNPKQTWYEIAPDGETVLAGGEMP